MGLASGMAPGLPADLHRPAIPSAGGLAPHAVKRLGEALQSPQIELGPIDVEGG